MKCVITFYKKQLTFTDCAIRTKKYYSVAPTRKLSVYIPNQSHFCVLIFYFLLNFSNIFLLFDIREVRHWNSMSKCLGKITLRHHFRAFPFFLCIYIFKQKKISKEILSIHMVSENCLKYSCLKYWIIHYNTQVHVISECLTKPWNKLPSTWPRFMKIWLWEYFHGLL